MGERRLRLVVVPSQIPINTTKPHEHTNQSSAPEGGCYVADLSVADLSAGRCRTR